VSTRDDDPRDAHLLAALRHAPDHDGGPPEALSAQIRARARQALPPPTAAAGPGLFERWFGWMSRPVAAGAFGTLLIAGFVGLMWRAGATARHRARCRPAHSGTRGGRPPATSGPAA
jgi:hypothetical protein